MKFLILIPVIWTATLGAQSSGTPPAGGPRSVADVQAYLSLTDSQIQSLQQLRTTERQTLSSTFQQIATQQQNLNTQLASGSATAAALGQILLDIQTLRKTITTTEASYNTQAVALLTADQKTKLAALQTAAALRPQISEATALGLLMPPSPPSGATGPGPSFRRGGGPRGGFFRGNGQAPPPTQ